MRARNANRTSEKTCFCCLYQHHLHSIFRTSRGSIYFRQVRVFAQSLYISILLSEKERFLLIVCNRGNFCERKNCSVHWAIQQCLLFITFSPELNSNCIILCRLREFDMKATHRANFWHTNKSGAFQKSRRTRFQCKNYEDKIQYKSPKLFASIDLVFRLHQEKKPAGKCIFWWDLLEQIGSAESGSLDEAIHSFQAFQRILTEFTQNTHSGISSFMLKQATSSVQKLTQYYVQDIAKTRSAGNSESGTVFRKFLWAFLKIYRHQHTKSVNQGKVSRNELCKLDQILHWRWWWEPVYLPGWSRVMRIFVYSLWSVNTLHFALFQTSLFVFQHFRVSPFPLLTTTLRPTRIVENCNAQDKPTMVTRRQRTRRPLHFLWCGCQSAWIRATMPRATP